MANVIGIVGVVVTGVALLLAILACTLPYWMVVDIGIAEGNFGLWKACVTIDGDTKCSTISKDSVADGACDDINVVKAMVLVGLVLLVPGIIIGILGLFVMKDKKILFFVAGIINIVAGLFMMIGFAYFLSELPEDGFDFGAAFSLDIVAWILAWVAGALFIVAKNKNLKSTHCRLRCFDKCWRYSTGFC